MPWPDDETAEGFDEDPADPVEAGAVELDDPATRLAPSSPEIEEGDREDAER